MPETEAYLPLLYIVVLFGSILVAPYFPPSLSGYVPVAGFGIVVFFAAGEPVIIELKGQRPNAVAATIRSDYDYKFSNRQYFYYEAEPDCQVLPEVDGYGNRYETKIACIAPFTRHPEFLNRVEFVYIRSKLPWSVLFTKGRGKTVYRGTVIKTAHVDICTLYELPPGEGIPRRRLGLPAFDPVYMVWETTGTYNIVTGKTSLEQIREAERMMDARAIVQ